MKCSRIAEESEALEASLFVDVDPVGNLSVFHTLLCCVERAGLILAYQQIAALSQRSAERK